MQIEKSVYKNTQVICLEDEGHWVRNNRNNAQLVDVLLSFLIKPVI